MTVESRHTQGVAAHHDKLAKHGIYALLAPQNRGGRKSEYVTAVFDEALLPLIKENHFSSLIDFGCGTGIFCRRISNFVENVTGVDISSVALEVAKDLCKKIPNVNYYLTDGEHLPFSGKNFDCAVAREALMYVHDSQFEIVLQEVYRVLKPGGSFLVLDQVSDDPHWQHYPGMPLQIKRPPWSIRNCAARVGFVLQSEYAVRTPRFPTVYLAWSGLIPRAFIPNLARFEVAWHRRHVKPKNRWWNSLFLFSKPR